MVNFFQKSKPVEPEAETKEIQPQHLLLAGAGLEILRELKQKIEYMEFKLSELEKKINERLPEKALTESKFKEEVQTSDDITNKILSEMKSIVDQKISQKLIENKLDGTTITESKKIQKIIDLLQQHSKLSSVQLAQLLDLSRSRANEYFKQMENLGLVEGFLIGKEKYYKIKDI